MWLLSPASPQPWSPVLGYAFGGAGELDEPVALDRSPSVDGFLGLGNVLGDSAKCAPGAIGAVLVIHDAVKDAAGLLVACRRPGFDDDLPLPISWSGCSSRHPRSTSEPSGTRVPRRERPPPGSPQRDVFGLGDHVGDDDDIGQVVGILEGVDHWRTLWRSRPCRPERLHRQRETECTGEQPDDGLEFRAAFTPRIRVEHRRCRIQPWLRTLPTAHDAQSV